MTDPINWPLAVSVLFAGLAACLWFASALVKFPSEVTHILIMGGGDKPEKDDLDRLIGALRTQSRLSAFGAVAAALAAVAQIWDLVS